MSAPSPHTAPAGGTRMTRTVRITGVPSVMWHFGGADPALFQDVDPDDLLENGLPATVPTNHSPHYAPVPDPTIEIGVTALLAAATHWLR